MTNTVIYCPFCNKEKYDLIKNSCDFCGYRPISIDKCLNCKNFKKNLSKECKKCMKLISDKGKPLNFIQGEINAESI